MPDLEKIVSGIKAVLQFIFGGSIPSFVLIIVSWILGIGLILCCLWGGLFVLSRIKELWIQHFLPLFYKREQKQRSLHRRYFAGHILSEIERLGRQEEWKDYRFAELEAEVEAEGTRRQVSFIPFIKGSSSGLRREKSLSKAIALSRERLILVEGEPGSGKSIALRHVTEKMATYSKRSRNTKSIIPIYVNLKELERKDAEVIDRNLIESFILKSLRRINDRDVDEFLKNEFDDGIRNGTWFFLFDSFDELPEILSSVEVDVMIKNYGDAIYDFLHGMNQCRGVVASRQFRGPTHFGWPHFRILALSEERRFKLIQKANLTQRIENELIGRLGNASQEIRAMASNPMLLNLLCEHMKNSHPFPENTYTVFETYINERLERDDERLRRRFGLEPTQVRKVAEQIAFSMSTDLGLGLSPSRVNLQKILIRLGMDVDKNFEKVLDALEYIKLARTEVATDITQSKIFTFAHRRFQEYFATCVVLRETFHVSSNQLLTDARWRETAVVLCQTQPIDQLSETLTEVTLLLESFRDNIPDLIELPLEYIQDLNQRVISKKRRYGFFIWPPGALHLLSLLQDGFMNRLKDLPDNIRLNVATLVLTANEMGTLEDKKWALEVSGIVPEPVLTYLLQSSLSHDSQWLREAGYRQAARLNRITPEVAQGIRKAIIYLLYKGRLYTERRATKAHLSRLDMSTDFLSVLRIMFWFPLIDMALFFFCISWIVPFIMMRIINDHTNLFIISNSLMYIAVAFLWFSGFFTLINIVYAKGGSFIYGFTMLLLIRSTICFFTIAFIHANIFRHLHLLIIFLVYLFVNFFGIFAFLAALAGCFTNYGWWLFLPIWPILFIIKRPLYSKNLIIRYINLRYLFLIMIGLIIVILYIYNHIYIDYIFVTILANATDSDKINTFINIFSTIYFIFLGAMAFIYSFYWIKDLLHWLRWKIAKPKLTSFEELCKAIGVYYSLSFFGPHIIRTVKKQRVLEPTSQAVENLKKLAFELEMEIEGKKKHKKDMQKHKWNIKRFDLMKTLGLKGDSLKDDHSKIIHKGNIKLVEEIYKFVEELTAS